MKAATIRGRFGSLSGALLIAGVFGSSVCGQDRGPMTVDAAGMPHSHDPVEIDARPIITRFKVSLVQPRRLLLGIGGSLFVADWGAGTVIRISPDGKPTVFADDLNEPAGLAQDTMGNLYVSTHAQGMTKEGKIYRIASDGMKRVFADGLTGPTGMAFDARGNLYVANFHDNSIVRVTPAGEVSTFAANVPSPSDLVFDEKGTMYVTSSTEGTVYTISPMGEIEVFARGLHSPSDLTKNSQGHLVVTNYGRGILSYVSRSGLVKTFAIVPRGTIAVLFDANGNLVVVNWDDHYLMKITTHFSIDCPHCDKKIPVRLRSRRRTNRPASEQKPPAPPII